jgi:hypothetical protein
MMKLKELLASTIVPAVPADDRGRKIGIFLLWLALVVLLSWNHAFWRDEVRALSMALQGSNFIDMLRGLHGEGHPAVWYLLLRAAHDLLDSSIALPIAAFAVACAAFLLLVLRAPFSWPLIALILLSKFAVFEYSVMARNYGISVLLMFSFAACYKTHRDRGVLLGSLLFLLANTNAHSVLLVGAFLLLWLVDLVSEHGTRWSKAHTSYAVNALIAAAGIVTCLATIYPTYNDIFVRDAGLTPADIAAALVPAVPFELLVPGGSWQGQVLGEALNYVVSLAMVGALLGLLRSRGAFIAGLAALLGLSLFFIVVTPGAYRHEALWLAFLITLYWIVWDKPVSPRRDVDRPHGALVSVVGSILFVGFLSLQLPGGLKRIANTAIESPPFSRSRDFGELVAQQPELEHAIVIADPDWLLEPLPYYVPNRTYLMREQRFGRVVRFKRSAQLSLSLDDVLSTARRLRAENNTSVLILLMARLDPDEPAYVRRQAYWELVVTPEQTREFLSSVRQIASFGPAESYESFDVYILENPCIRQLGATLEENTAARNSAAPDPSGETECSKRN